MTDTSDDRSRLESGEAAGGDRWVPLPGVDPASIGRGRGRKVHLRRADGAVLELLVVRDEAGWAAVDTLCPHAGGRFEEELVGGRLARCPLHDLRFDPRTGESVGEACRPATVYPARVADVLEVRLPFAAEPIASPS